MILVGVQLIGMRQSLLERLRRYQVGHQQKHGDEQITPRAMSAG